MTAHIRRILYENPGIKTPKVMQILGEKGLTRLFSVAPIPGRIDLIRRRMAMEGFEVEPKLDRGQREERKEIAIAELTDADQKYQSLSRLAGMLNRKYGYFFTESYLRGVRVGLKKKK